MSVSADYASHTSGWLANALSILDTKTDAEKGRDTVPLLNVQNAVVCDLIDFLRQYEEVVANAGIEFDPIARWSGKPISEHIIDQEGTF